MAQPVPVDYNPFGDVPSEAQGQTTFAPVAPPLQGADRAQAAPTPPVTTAPLPPLQPQAVDGNPFGDQVAPGGLAGLITGQNRQPLTPGQQAAYDRATLALKYGSMGGTGQGSAAEHGLASGSTWGFQPTIQGGLDALGQGAVNIGRAIQGKPIISTMGDAYTGARQADLDYINGLRQRYPVTSATSEIAGSFAAPGMAEMNAAIRAPTIAERVIQGSGVVPKIARTVLSGAERTARATGAGAIGGGLYGAGNSPNGQEAQGFDQGAQTGGLVGGIAHVGIPVAAAPIKLAGKALSRIPAGIGGAVQQTAEAFGAPTRDATITPDATAQAQRYIASVAAKAGITADDVANNPAVANGLPITAAQALGRNGVNKAMALGSMSGRSPDLIEQTAKQQLRELPSSVVDTFGDVAGIDPHAAYDDFAARAAAGRQTAAPLYQQAYSVGGVDTPELQTLLGRPSMQSALGRAARIAAEEGRNPQELGFVTTSSPNPGGGTVTQQVQVSHPTMQTWDYVKRGLDDVLQTYRDKTTGKLNLDEEGRATLGTLNNLRAQLTDPNTPWGPSYRAALDAGGEPLQLEQAFRDAGKFMGNRVPMRNFQAAWSKYTPAQQQSFLGGVADNLYQQLQSGALNMKAFNAPNFRAKLAAVIGPDKADQFISQAEQHIDLANSARRMMPGTNSTTAEKQEAMGEMKGDAAAEFATKPIETIVNKVAGVLSAPVVGFARGAGTPLNAAGRDEFGRLLMQPATSLPPLLQNAPKRVPTRLIPTTPIAATAAGQRNQ